MAREGQVMTSERLAEIQGHLQRAYQVWRADDVARAMQREYPDLAHDFTCDGDDLLAELERLRAREAALAEALSKQGKLVELIAAEAWYGHDAPYYSELRRIMEAHKRDWYSTSKTQARALLASAGEQTHGEA